MTFAGFARGPETYLGQQKDSFPLGTYLPGWNSTGIKKKGGFSVCRVNGYSLPLQGLPVQEAGIQQLQYLQAMQWYVSAAVLGKAMQSSTRA